MPHISIGGNRDGQLSAGPAADFVAHHQDQFVGGADTLLMADVAFTVVRGARRSTS